MKENIEEIKKRLGSLSRRLHPIMGQVNYIHQFTSRVANLERIIDQLDREIEPLIEHEKPKRRRKSSNGS